MTYYVHPVKAAIVKSGKVSKLTTIYADKPIKTDITAAQIGLWNQGKLPIKASNILQSIVLYTADNAPILEASIRKVSRDVIKLQLQTDESESGRIAISWQILEQNDFGIIQLIYAGSPDVGIRLSGIIEGQKQIEQVIFKQRFKSLDEQYSAATSAADIKLLYFFLYMFLGIFLLKILTNLIRHKPLFAREDLFYFILFAVFVGVSLWEIFSKKIEAPPFGF